MKPIKHTIHQLLTLASMAYDGGDDRPRISQVHWAPDWVAATNGHRMIVVSLPHDRSRDFGISAASLRRWLAGPGHAKTEICTIAIPTIQDSPPVTRALLTTTGGGAHEGILIPVSGKEYAPVAASLPPGCVDPAGALCLLPPEKRIVTPHVIAPAYLEGVHDIATAFHGHRNGLELLAAPAPLEPILYGCTMAESYVELDLAPDPVLLYLVMPMRPSWCTTRVTIMEVR